MLLLKVELLLLFGKVLTFIRWSFLRNVEYSHQILFQGWIFLKLFQEVGELVE